MCARSAALFAVLVSCLVAPAALADSLSGHERFICSAVEASVCSAEGECASGLSWDLQIPQFVLVDLNRKTLSTTEASDENRSTPILSQVREDGHIFLQGVQMGRAFSMVLKEDSGLASIAIAMDGLTLGVFGACTPGLPR
jgi:hypothetical protein